MYILVVVGVKLIGVYLFYYFPSLLVGTLLCSYMTNTIGKKEYIIATIAILLFLIYDYSWVTVVGSVIIIPMLLYLPDYKNKYLTFLGNMSYSIYLMHSITGIALVNYFSHIVVNPIAKVLIVVAGVLFTLICSYVFYRLVEKPVHRLSLKIAVNEHELKSNPKTKSKE